MAENCRHKRTMPTDFVEKCCHVQNGLMESASRLYRRFAPWYVTRYQTQDTPTKKKFGDLLGNHFNLFKQGTKYYRAST